MLLQNKPGLMEYFDELFEVEDNSLYQWFKREASDQPGLTTRPPVDHVTP